MSKSTFNNKLSIKLKLLGVITGTKGVAGKLLLSDCLAGLYLPAGTEISIGFSEDFSEQFKLAGDTVTYSNKTELQIVGVTNKEQAELLKEKAIFVERDILLASNINYIFEDEIIGSKVINIDTGDSIGTISEIWELPANNVWLVATDNGDLPLPVIDDVIKFVDLENKIVQVHILDGLLDIITNKSSYTSNY